MNKKDLYIGKTIYSGAYGYAKITAFIRDGWVQIENAAFDLLKVHISSLYESSEEHWKTFQKEIPEARNANYVATSQPAIQSDVFIPRQKLTFTTPKNKVTMKSSTIKPDYYLLPHDALNEVAMVLAKSKEKYPPENWRDIPNWRHEFYSAAMRHMQNWRVGKTKDDGEGGLGTHHLANAICNLMFILDKELKGDN